MLLKKPSFQRYWKHAIYCLFAATIAVLSVDAGEVGNSIDATRERILINEGWKFFKYGSDQEPDKLVYDVRPDVSEYTDMIPADSKPTEAVGITTDIPVLKAWILPTANAFIQNQKQHHVRPEGNPGSDFPYVQSGFDDSGWESIHLPHDWAVEGPFYVGEDVPVGGGMGRLPIQGVAWYRKQLDIPEADRGKSIFLEIEGAMSYAMVWLNGNLVGGWPYSYSSWQLDLTPYIQPGGENQLAIRVDNPPMSSRWYPGAGIYRDVWLIKTQPVHIAQWGTFVTTPEVKSDEAEVNLQISIANNGLDSVEVKVKNRIFEYDGKAHERGSVVSEFETTSIQLSADQNSSLNLQTTVNHPRMWGPPPQQQPNLYLAVTELYLDDRLIDVYETPFGIRSLEFNPDRGVFVNGELIKLQGVNQHHDLGALGAAFNRRAAERQLEILQEMGCNAIRMSHNPPAPGLLDLCDEMGFLVMDETLDAWERKKNPLDFHLIFPDWKEADTRSLVRRDRNHPSVIIWSVGNEVGEQYTGESGAELCKMLSEIVHEEDSTRPTTASMNWAKPDMPFPGAMDLISLNYQGEGIRQDPIFDGTDRIRTPPMYPAFHAAFPDKVVVSSESASAFSSRGVYMFPVAEGDTSYIRDGIGGDSSICQVSSYELYAVDFGSAADVVFRKQDENPYVAGEFVWSGFDYLGEPTPYYSARSSYCGIVDLAGFPKDRFYLYQSRWRPDLPMAHLLPHWNWLDRIGQVTPVHVFTSGDEAELFLNGKSLGRKCKGHHQYRLRWDDVLYEPGELKVITYKNGFEWAKDSVCTTGGPVAVELLADRSEIRADGEDLSFVTVRVVDERGLWVRNANTPLKFSLEGPGEIVAADNGDPTDMTAFPSHERSTFSGLCLILVRGVPGQPGILHLRVEGQGVGSHTLDLKTL